MLPHFPTAQLGGGGGGGQVYPKGESCKGKKKKKKGKTCKPKVTERLP